MRVTLLSLFSVFVALLLFVCSDCAATEAASFEQAPPENLLNVEDSLRYIEEEGFRKNVAGRARLTLSTAAIFEYFGNLTFRERVDALLDSGVEITSDVDRLDLSWRRDVVDIRLLARLEHLQLLDLSGTQVQNIEPLAGLVTLRTLFLFRTQVQNIELLAGLVKLERLDLSSTQVQNIEPLAGLVNLDELSLSVTQVQNIEPLAGLVNLQELYLSRTRVQSIEPLAGLEKLRGHIYWDAPRLQIAPHAQIVNVLPDGEDQCNCAVCLEPFDKLSECLKVCGTNHCHRSCLATWEASCAAESRDFTCPLCRAKMGEVPARETNTFQI